MKTSYQNSAKKISAYRLLDTPTYAIVLTGLFLCFTQLPDKQLSHQVSNIFVRLKQLTKFVCHTVNTLIAVLRIDYINTLLCPLLNLYLFFLEKRSENAFVLQIRIHFLFSNVFFAFNSMSFHVF